MYVCVCVCKHITLVARRRFPLSNRDSNCSVRTELSDVGSTPSDSSHLFRTCKSVCVLLAMSVCACACVSVCVSMCVYYCISKNSETLSMRCDQVSFVSMGAPYLVRQCVLEHDLTLASLILKVLLLESLPQIAVALVRHGVLQPWRSLAYVLRWWLHQRTPLAA